MMDVVVPLLPPFIIVVSCDVLFFTEQPANSDSAIMEAMTNVKTRFIKTSFSLGYVVINIIQVIVLCAAIDYLQIGLLN